MNTVTKIINTKGFCAVDQAQKLSVQDEFGRATSAGIRQYWKELGDNRDARRNFVWLAFVCLSQDSALDVLKVTVLADERDEAARYQEEEWGKIETATNELLKEKREFEAERKATESQVALRDDQIAELQGQVIFERQAKIAAREQRDAMGDELSKYRQVVAGLRTLRELLA